MVAKASATNSTEEPPPFTRPPAPYRLTIDSRSTDDPYGWRPIGVTESMSPAASDPSSDSLAASVREATAQLQGSTVAGFLRVVLWAVAWILLGTAGWWVFIGPEQLTVSAVGAILVVTVVIIAGLYLVWGLVVSVRSAE